jgi:cell division protein FtsZ
VVPLPNDVLLQEAGEKESVLDAFGRADEWIGRGVKAIWAMLLRTGMINVDFATLRQVFQTRGGKTLFGLGSGSGENASGEAIESLKQCPLLASPEVVRKADRLLVNITGGPDLPISRVNELMQAITDEFGLDSHVIMGAVIDEGMKGRVELVVLGTTDIVSRNRGSVRPPAAIRAKTTTSKAAAAAKQTPLETIAQKDFSLPPSSDVPADALHPESQSTSDPVLSSPDIANAASSSSPVKAEKAQEEFLFGEVEARGHFENTDRNLFEGQDLDVPTYLRKGIKLVL